jgi:hypothetical protein
MAVSTIDNSSISPSAGISTSKLGTGAVLQVVSAKGTSTISGTGNVDIISASITPSSASNKILVSAFFTSSLTPTTNTYMTGYIFRGTNAGTNIFSNYAGAQIAVNNVLPFAGSVLDSPSTTSSQTYTLVGGKGSGGTTSWSTESTTYSIILMEIAG